MVSRYVVTDMSMQTKQAIRMFKKTNKKKQICHVEVIETLGKAKQLCSALLRIALASSASPKGIQEHYFLDEENPFTTFS